MKGCGCSASRCHTRHILKGKVTGHRCTTDWGHANLFRANRLHRSDRSQQRPVQFCSSRLEYHAKEKKDDVQPMQVDSGKATVDNIVQIGDVNVVVK